MEEQAKTDVAVTNLPPKSPLSTKGDAISILETSSPTAIFNGNGTTVADCPMDELTNAVSVAERSSPSTVTNGNGTTTPDGTASSSGEESPTTSSTVVDSLSPPTTISANGTTAWNAASWTDGSPTSSNSLVDPEYVAQVGTLHLVPEVLRRVNALRKLQFTVIDIDGEKFREVHALEQKYAALFKPFWEKRRQIIAGEHEPTEEECEFPLEEDEYCFMKHYQDWIRRMTAAAEANKTTFALGPQLTGVPGFWRQICRNVKLLRNLVQEWDKPILEHLVDVHYELAEDPLSYTVIFYFTRNPFFKNATLTKTYELRPGKVGQVPLWFNGLEIYKATGCEIDWYPGKSVTQESPGTESDPKKRDSFFHFFDTMPYVESIQAPDDLDFTCDAELAKYIKQRIVCRAVLFFTGEETRGVYETYSEINSDCVTESESEGETLEEYSDLEGDQYFDEDEVLLPADDVKEKGLPKESGNCDH